MISPIKLTDSQKKFLKLVDIAGSPNATMQEVIDADISAIKIYLSMGHSAKDAYIAFEKTFNHSDKERLNTVHKFIDEYNNGRD